MARAHLLKTITDNAGNVLVGASIRVLRPGTNTPVTDAFFGTDAGSTPLTNPFTALNGVVSIYMDAPQRVSLGVTVGTNPEVLFEDVDVLEPAEGAFQTAAETPYTSSNVAITATNVQDALDQIYALAGASTHAGGGFNSVEVGPNAVASSDETTALGHNADASTFQASALGEGTVASGTGATAVGQSADATANQTTALGTDAQATALRATAAGTEANASAVDGTALGYRAAASGLRSTAAGSGATATEADTWVAKGDTFVVQPSSPGGHATQVRVYGANDAPHTIGVDTAGLLVDGTPLTATEIGFTPAGTIAATNTQAAVEEVASDAAAALADHVAASDPHPQYLTASEGNGAYDPAGAAASAQTAAAADVTSRALLKANNLSGLTDAAVARTNLGLGTAATHVATDFDAAGVAAAGDAAHVAAADPHAQYLTQARGDARYPLKTDTDPYPQYLTQARGDARYAPSTISTGTTVDEEGVALTQRPTINFVGRRVTAVDDAANNRTNIVVAQPFALKTANYTLTLNDDVVFFNGANLVATLPTPVGNAGLQFTVKNTNATVLMVTPSAGTIDGDASRNLAQYDAIIVVSDGANWGVI